MIEVEFKAFPKISRFNREIIVTEKIDGTNAQVMVVPLREMSEFPDAIAQAVAEIGGEYLVYAGSRSRWLKPEKGYDNHGFARWVYDNAEDLAALGPGRHYGEWWGSGINRGYGLPANDKRFSLFNVSRWTIDGRPPACCSTVPIIYQGDFGTDAVEDSLGFLAHYGSLAALGFGRPEGVVVYHTAGNVLFKQTIENDDAPKSELRAA